MVPIIADERPMYDALYSGYEAGRTACPASCHDLDKARRNVEGAMRTFGIASLEKARVLDIGCGLGYFAEALRQKGARVTAVDSSPVAIEVVNELFPKLETRVACFPQDFMENDKFDLIWSCDLSLLNTFDADFICREFIQKSLALLSKGGSLILSWHSNFDGTMGGSQNWAHWPLPMIKRMKEKGGLIGPRIVTIPTPMLSYGVVRLSRILKKSIPIYFFRRA